MAPGRPPRDASRPTAVRRRSRSRSHAPMSPAHRTGPARSGAEGRRVKTSPGRLDDGCARDEGIGSQPHEAGCRPLPQAAPQVGLQVLEHLASAYSSRNVSRWRIVGVDELDSLGADLAEAGPASWATAAAADVKLPLLASSGSIVVDVELVERLLEGVIRGEPVPSRPMSHVGRQMAARRRTRHASRRAVLDRPRAGGRRRKDEVERGVRERPGVRRRPTRTRGGRAHRSPAARRPGCGHAEHPGRRVEPDHARSPQRRTAPIARSPVPVPRSRTRGPAPSRASGESRSRRRVAVGARPGPHQVR